MVPEQISSAVTTGKWEKALSAMAGFQDAQLRGAKSERFLQGIDRFSIFLVDAARNARTDVQFENEFGAKKRPARRPAAKAKPRQKTAKAGSEKNF